MFAFIRKQINAFKARSTVDVEAQRRANLERLAASFGTPVRPLRRRIDAADCATSTPQPK
ncbi:hypothetical protein ABIC83_002810 [Roseateles asaccharophilus]|uniref:hypothetical protein n=1 Tax=Roseateles asaccharophilus TaxID=582607 RepID=UPI0038347964